MVELLNAKLTKYGSIQIKNKELELFAYAQLKEFDRNHFKEPHPLDIDSFVEFYLNKTVLYYQLSPKDDEKRILGTTIISEGKTPIINEYRHIELRVFKKGTIIIDTNACDIEQRRRFTLAHEAWHSQFDLYIESKMLNNDNLIYNNGFANDTTIFPRRKWSQKQWIEYHADMYSTYLLMPRKFVCALFKKFHKECFGKEKRLTAKKSKRTWLIIKLISDALCVSQKAVAYRLRELNLISKNIFNSLTMSKIKEEIK
ncbi:MAG TPA: hypothetical protein DDW20_04070 [Firmicutes bacterium]|nr:hypothetical protein [Bacillota bacterium]